MEPTSTEHALRAPTAAYAAVVKSVSMREEPEGVPNAAIGSTLIGNAGSTMSLPHPLLAVLAPKAERWAPELSKRATAAGLALTQPDGTTRAIPIGALPVILDDAQIASRAAVAVRLVRATAKAARWRMAGPGRNAVLAALGSTERRLVEATWDGTSDLAVARVDFLGDETLHALEVNATIPAMQGYSDIAAEAWLATVAAGRSDLPELIAANGSNARALLDVLLRLHGRARGDELGSIGVLCRRADAQSTELEYLRNRFRSAGLHADLVHPDELGARRGYLMHRDRPLQLIYRHLFLSRLDATPSPALEAAMCGSTRHGTLVLNRPAPHLEMKSTLALISCAADSPGLADAIGLDEDERTTIRTTVPWTRSLAPDAGDERIQSDALDHVRSNPDDFVLKRSWSYGGHEVFVGRVHESQEFRTRMRTSYPEVGDWAAFVDRAASDPRGGGFVVQRAVERVMDDQVLCAPTVVERTRVVTDYAAYASIGTDAPWSGVCRAATSDVVNIVGGGAVVPIIRRAIADRLLAKQ